MDVRKEALGISIGGRDGIFGRPVELLIDVDMMILHEKACEQVKSIIYRRAARWVQLRLSCQWALTGSDPE